MRYLLPLVLLAACGTSTAPRMCIASTFQRPAGPAPYFGESTFSVFAKCDTVFTGVVYPIGGDTMTLLRYGPCRHREVVDTVFWRIYFIGSDCDTLVMEIRPPTR